MPIQGKAKARYNRDYYLKRSGQGYKLPTNTEKRVLVSMRIEQSIVARVQKLVAEGIATGRYPWKTQAACWKALILGGFDHMKGDEYIDEMLPYLRLMSHIDGVEAHRREAQAALSRMKTAISELLAIKATDEAATHYHMLLEDFEKMPPNVWRDWLIREARKAFPDLLKQRPASLRLLHGNKRRLKR